MVCVALSTSLNAGIKASPSISRTNDGVITRKSQSHVEEKEESSREESSSIHCLPKR